MSYAQICYNKHSCYILLFNFIFSTFHTLYIIHFPPFHLGAQQKSCCSGHSCCSLVSSDNSGIWDHQGSMSNIGPWNVSDPMSEHMHQSEASRSE